jgi:hypothetical protein
MFRGCVSTCNVKVYRLQLARFRSPILRVGYARASFREKEGRQQAAGADDGALVSMMQQHVRRQDPDCTSKNRVRRQENM